MPLKLLMLLRCLLSRLVVISSLLMARCDVVASRRGLVVISSLLMALLDVDASRRGFVGISSL